MEFIWFQLTEMGWRQAAAQLEHKKNKLIALQIEKQYVDMVNGYMMDVMTRDELIEEMGKRFGTTMPEKDPRTGWIHILDAAKKLDKGVYPIAPNPTAVLDSIKQKVKIDEKLKILKQAESWYVNRTGWFSRFLSLVRFPFSLLPQSEAVLKIEMSWAKFWLSLFSKIVNFVPGDQNDYVAALKFMLDAIEDKMVEEIQTVAKVGKPVVIAEEIFVGIKTKLAES
ncbi:MAG: hypothetical protein GOU99_00045 [Candidatus Altiarchaeota archaeon]|nr:hypothetical protein [Candidatus Altiarchaeota archaeon]